MLNSKHFNYSYWELKTFFKQFDLIVIGSGIVGLSTAISFIEKNPNASVLILEQGWQPNGASTKNAGFACFGSAGELLTDLKNMNEEAVWQTVQMRWDGLQILRNRLGDLQLKYEENGGFELFFSKNDFEATAEKITILNKKIYSVLGLQTCYSVFPTNYFKFKGCAGIIKNHFEGQIDTAGMMQNLLFMVYNKKVQVLNNIRVSEINDLGTHVELNTPLGTFSAKRVVVATNGFASELLNLDTVKPARAQVLVTRPISNLPIKGTFHFDEGFYYFRNIDNRLLFGGGRNLDIEGETTMSAGLNEHIHNQLDRYLKERLLPEISFEIEARWSGIMGVGQEKKPIISNYSKNVIAAVRMGGMGIAIGSLVGEKAARLAAEI